MLAVKRQLGLPILLTALFLITVTSLFLRSGASTGLKEITVLGNGLWQDEAGSVNGVQLVVFGDSWADSTIEKGYEGKGRSWTTTLCEELKCKSLLNFARSAQSSSSTKEPPHGVVTSNKIIQDAITKGRLPAVNFTLPDLSAQIQSFVSLPKSKYLPTETTFIVSLGFWDIYQLAGHDFDASPRIIDTLVGALFTQLTVLYTHFQYNLPQPIPGQNSTVPEPKFRVIVPKVFDPTIAPGWQTQRPIPAWPNNIAEQQRNAVHLTDRWNMAVENRLAIWLKTPKTTPDEERLHAEVETAEQRQLMERDAFYYDMPEYILDEIVERSLEIEGLSDANGLGSGESQYDDVYLSCVSDDIDVSENEYDELDGMVVCKSPKDFLWWDGWNLGSLANEEVGKNIAQMMKSDDTFRRVLKETGTEGFV